MHSLHSCTLSKCQSVNNARGNISEQQQKKKSNRARVQGMYGSITGKWYCGNEKKHRKSNIGKIPFQYPEKGDSIPVVCYNYYSERCRCYDYGQWEKKEGKDMFRDFLFSEKSHRLKPQPLPWTLFVFLIAQRVGLRVKRVYVQVLPVIPKLATHNRL